jgi:hypothetical protein
LLLVRSQLGRAAHLDAAIAGGRQAGPGPFADHRPLEFGEAPEHLHDHAARSGCGIHRLGEAPEAGGQCCNFAGVVSDAKLFANRSALFANDAESAMIACSLL